ncbi:glutaredoxin domain-containing protein [Halorhabdus salina]|uniref:glutaredoxin domain-containing protein n=1 Tax=Halorhabdus salina TaxID=2750670 RepID=UPI0015EF9FC5|nr:glutaredoxin domain-containing protein [Halorhabdus salina]
MLAGNRELLVRTISVVFCLLLVVGVFGGAVGPAVGAQEEDTRSATNAITTNETGSVTVVFFYLPGCPHCGNVEQFLEAQRDEYEFTVEKYNARDHPRRFAQYLQGYDVPREQWGPVPVVFVGDEYAIGEDRAIELLEQRFEAAQMTPETKATTDVARTARETPDEATTDETTTAESANDKPGTHESPTKTVTGKSTEDPSMGTLLTLAGLALGDAVNPCALAVLVVLLTTILTRHPERPRTVIAAGLTFALTIAVAYGAMGALLVFGFKSAGAIDALQIAGIRQLFGVLAIGLGLFELKDGISHGAGGFTMEVPESWRPGMQRRLTEPLWAHSTIVGAVLAGVGVSLFLLPCTAGPYVVAGGMLASLPWQQSLPLLGAYNLLFVAPMIAITLVVGSGYVAADAVGEWRQRHLETLHLVAGGLLVVLGGALAGGII